MYLRTWFPFILAILWFIIRAIGGQMLFDGDYDKGRTLGVLSNLLFILLAIFVAILQVYKEKSSDQRTFFEDVRHCMAASVKYLVGVVVFIGIYYGVMSEELANKRMRDYELIAIALDSPEKIAAIQAENPMLQHSTKEQILHSAMERTDLFTSLRVIIPSSLLALLTIALVYSLLATFIYRRFLIKK